MVANHSLDLILSTIALVFEPSEDKGTIELTQEILETFLRKPLQVTVLPGDRVFATSNRDQIEIQFHNNKLDVRDASGDIEHGVDTIPRILLQAVTISPKAEAVSSYGINFIVDIDIVNPRIWLGDNLLNPNLLSGSYAPITSNIASLIMKHEQKDWTIRFQEQQGKLLNINFNASEAIDELPNRELLRNDIYEQYSRFKNLLGELGLLSHG